MGRKRERAAMDAAVKAVSRVQGRADWVRRILYRDQPRFHREDTSYRLIPKRATQDELSVWHFGYRIEDAAADHNCVFPLNAMRQLQAEGVIGEFADPAYSFMGGVYSARKIRDELAPAIVSELRRAHADALFLVPA